jgi:hypothetical protein
MEPGTHFAATIAVVSYYRLPKGGSGETADCATLYLKVNQA